MSFRTVADSTEPTAHAEEPTLSPEISESGTGREGGDRKPADSGGGTPKEDRASRDEAKQLRQRITELEQSERYWADVAKKGGSGGGAAVKPEEEDEPIDMSGILDEDVTGDPEALKDDTSTKFVDDLSASGVEALRKRGFITHAEARKIATEAAVKAAVKAAKSVVGRERDKLSADARVANDFPDLRPGTDMFQETAKIFQAKVARNPALRKDPNALYDAAELAKERLENARLKAGNTGDGRRGATTYDEMDERVQRINAQAGDGGDRRRAAFDDEEDAFTPDTLQFIKLMGVSKEKFAQSKAALGPRRAAGGRR